MKKIITNIIIGIVILLSHNLGFGQNSNIPFSSCITQITVGPGVNQVELSAKDLNDGSFDLQTNREELRYTFSNVEPSLDPSFDSNTNTSSQEFLKSNGNTQSIEMVVWDNDDNSSFCTVNIVFVETTLNKADLIVETGSANNVEIKLENIVTSDISTTTNNIFNNVEQGSYSITATKNDEILNGVSTLDLVIIQRHIMGFKKLDNPDSYFAADVKKDNSINMLDMTQLRRVILGKEQGFPANTSFRFRDEEQNFPLDLSKVLTVGLKESIRVEMNSTDVSRSFKGIKTGDIHSQFSNLTPEILADLNRSVIEMEEEMRLASKNFVDQSTLRVPGDTVTFTMEPTEINGTSICVPIKVNSFNNISGFQFPISWDINKLELIDINSDLSGLIYNDNIEGVVYFGMSEPSGSLVNLDENYTIAECCFKVLDTGLTVANISFESDSGFELGVYDNFEVVPFIFNSSALVITPGCLDHYTKEVYIGGALVFANELYVGAEPGDIIKMNGVDSIFYECTDLGEHLVSVTIENANGIDTCEVIVNIVDYTRPVAICDGNLSITLDQDLNYIIDPAVIDDGSFDACGEVTFSVSPSILNCDSPNPSLVTLTVTDESGNSTQCVNLVNIIYPSIGNGSLSCNFPVEILVNPNSNIEITADMILQGDYSCPNHYNVVIKSNGVILDNFIDNTDAGNTYEVEVIDPVTGSTCWSQLNIVSSSIAVEFNIPHITSEPGDQVCIPVSVQNFKNVVGFQYGISWDPTILEYNRVDIPANAPDLNYNDQITGKLIALWSSSTVEEIDLPNDAILMEICFDVIGIIGDYSTLSFDYNTNSNIENKVFSLTHDIFSQFNAGSVFVGQIGSCTTFLTASLGIGPVTLWGTDFVNDVQLGDVILIDGEESISLGCEDIGNHTFSIQTTHTNGEVESCTSVLTLEDQIAPNVLAGADRTITMTTDQNIELTEAFLGFEVHDNCTITNVTINPSNLDCTSYNPTIVKITATDQVGNTTTAQTVINIDYQVADEVLTCINNVSISVMDPVELTPEMVLFGEYDCIGSFTITIEDPVTGEPFDDNILNLEDIGQTYTYNLSSGGNSCLGLVIVEGIDCSEGFIVCDTKCHTTPVGDCASGHTLNDGVEWPCDIVITNCSTNQLSPENLLLMGVDPEDAEPTLYQTECSLVAKSYTDEVFNTVGEYFIRRTWYIIDWEQYSPSTNDGIFTYIQRIDVEPTLEDIEIVWPENLTLSNGTCDFNIDNLSPDYLLTFPGVEESDVRPHLTGGNCSAIDFTYTYDVFDTGAEVKVISHWKVINWSTSEEFNYDQEIIVHKGLGFCDTKAWDTPFGDCASGHTSDDGIEWPADFSIDNTNITPIELSQNLDIHINNIQPRLFSDCGDFRMIYSDSYVVFNDLIEVTRNWLLLDNGVWITDYRQLITVTAGFSTNSACAFTTIGDGLADVDMIANFSTNDGGCVSLENITDGTEITPSKVDDWANGLDMVDEILMRKAVLGIDELTPYQLIAADINGNGVLTTVDILLLKKIIEGTHTPTTEPWRFIDAAYVFDDNYEIGSVPTDYPNSITYNSSPIGYHFVGIKMGDLNYNYEQNNVVSLNTSLVIKDIILNNGETYLVPILTSEVLAVEGVRFELSFDADKVKINNVTSDVLPSFNEDNYRIENDKIVLEYSVPLEDLLIGGINLAINSSLFNIEMEAITNGIISESVSLNGAIENILKAKKYQNPYHLDIEWKNKVINKVINIDDLISLEVFPQPASDILYLEWNNSTTEKTQYDITNIMGQKMKSSILEDDKIDISDLNSGIYMMKLYQNNQVVSISKFVVNK